MLISNARLAAMRKIANRALIDDVVLCRRVMTRDQYGSDWQASWPDGETVKGWLIMTNTPVIDDRSGIATSYGVFRLNVPATVTDLNVDDQVSLGGRRYVINDTNGDDSYRIYTTAMLRKLDQREF